MKRGNAVLVEAVLFESPVVAGLAATVNTALAAAPRRKQRTFTIDLSGVYTGPLSAVFKSNDSPDGSAGVDLAPAQTLTFSTAGYASRKATLPAALQRAGYVFQGWNTKQNGSGAAFTAASDVTGAMTVYAKWAKKSGAAAANEAAAIGVSLSWPGSGAGWIAESSGSLVRDLDNEFITGVNPLKAAALAIATADLADAGDSGATLPYDGSGTAGHATSWQSKNSASEADFVIYYKIPGAASYASASENLYFRFSWDNGPWSPWQWAVNSATDTSSFQTSAGDLYFKTSQIFADGGPGSWVTKGDLLTLEIALFDGAVVAVPNRPVDLLTPSTRARRKERLFTVDLSEVTITP
jgi:uncharacterized repeat protein (TIGR02543 family)